ncbi:MAG: hypothetical protein A2275_15035 [Bacteroidetes bacterium RIFOXYA12_FULL_35_11]|nr:MAG: hypothetical protein A2X01_17940 [Bacteroidetes bacterium GWF2_35_48]OFY80181.1 MAG: hypothetical protein A2275_15035 [Bacteroidetes bacterium RIFOXYA12_FULL_35_11]OFY93519.1 MAG: hypothetical protein A2491_09450 [Bacteroidetes bacterium RIFOXYC12_FULL_35_7]OFY96812.1 MAG: hypothetical protein A2309_10405 [Bacteroidetes bacterium RIFOXYB2_FULL_35_7]HBX51740.1 hypothetical protein [Bacteroidales bacterium]
MIKKLFILLFLSLLFFTNACEKDNFSLLSVKDRLTQRKWIMRSFVDYQANQTFPVSKTSYQFKWDGTYIITKPDNEQIFSTWELIDNNKYLRIGTNTFRISYISGRLLSLQYGDMNIFYVPE